MLDKTVYGVENSSSFLECSPKSQRALTYWQFQRHGEDRKQEVRSVMYTVEAKRPLVISRTSKKFKSQLKK